ncbi:MAG TPA: ATP-binding protein [Thermoanaerobaculia bacterium]|nr:ATP-binding protein [Thermoanaerobaculia bacterium]
MPTGSTKARAPSAPHAREKRFRAAIAAAKEVEEQLRASEERHRALADALPDLVFRVARDGTYLDCRAGRTELLLLPPSEFLGKKIAEVLPAGLARDLQAEIERALATGAIQVLEYDLAVDGEPRSFEARTVQSGANEVVSVVRDITERKRNDEQQKRLQAAISKAALEWQLTFDAITMPLLLLDRGGRILRLNESARRLCGRSFAEVVLHPMEVLGDTEPWRAIHALLDEVAATQAPAATEARDAQGRAWEVQVSAATVPEPQLRLVAAARDITDRIKLQESLLRSETMSAMGTLLAGVAHEVRNPLFGISATLDAFEARCKHRPAYRNYFAVLRTEVTRLSELMRGLLDYGKPPRLDLAPAQAAKLAATAVSACAALASQSGVEIEVRIGAGLPAVQVDRKRIVQVLQNLLENAIQHSPPGGSVMLRAELGGGESLRFAVEDSGPGFHAADFGRIFEPFFTRRRGGTGLGLSIVQRIVEHHRGEIAVANRPEGGAAITVTLPLGLPGAGEA